MPTKPRGLGSIRKLIETLDSIQWSQSLPYRSDDPTSD
jgi:hypothetical protein